MKVSHMRNVSVNCVIPVLVENEIQFVLVCNYFIYERQSCISRYYREHPSELNFVNCCSVLKVQF